MRTVHRRPFDLPLLHNSCISSIAVQQVAECQCVSSKRPCCVRRMSMVCPQIVRALSTDRLYSCLQIVRALSVDRPYSVHRSSMLCPQNVRTLSTERPYSVHRLSVLCPLIVRALSTEHPCSVCAACASVYYVSLYPQSN